jgi:hypothetical protein
VAHLRKAGVLDRVTNVVATSSGSIVGLLFALGKMEAGLRVILGHDYEADVDLTNLAGAQGFGLDSGKTIQRLLDKILDPPSLTLQQLRRQTGVNLCACTTNVTRRTTQLLTADSHPDLPVAAAVRASCSVPLVFAAQKIEGDWHCDGGVAANFPLAQARALFPRSAGFVGICYEPEKAGTERRDSFAGFVAGLFETFSSSSSSSAPRASRDALIVRLAPGCGAMDLKMKSVERYRTFLRGARQCKQVLKKLA